MDDSVKVYTNETISDTAFPAQPDSTTVTDKNNTTSATSSMSSSNTTIPQQGFPTQPIAVDIISQTLNTKTKKIIQEFQFTPSGAIQIGNFEQGVAGDIRIDPNGIIARNFLGDTTIAIDGDTGDAVFSGIIQTGTLIAGQVAIGNDAIQIDGQNRRIIFYDTNGIPSIVIGEV